MAGERHFFLSLFLLLLLPDVLAWDPVAAFYQLEKNHVVDRPPPEAARNLNVLTNRPDEVSRHHDITTQFSGDEAFLGPAGSRIFEDIASCGVLASDTPCCNETCTDLSFCTALNGKRIEDKYYPTLPYIHGTCLNLDDRASRLVDRYSVHSIFGDYHTNRPFKDTEECRQMVLDYTCLFWATMDNDRCFYRDHGKNLSGTPAYFKSARGSMDDAPRRPCRSFCMEVGLECANDPFSWVNLCHNIECPVQEGMCARSANNTNAYAEGSFENGNKDCYVYKLASAYSAAVPSPLRRSSSSGAGLACWWVVVAVLSWATWSSIS